LTPSHRRAHLIETGRAMPHREARIHDRAEN
jgi:hypothetical protein